MPRELSSNEEAAYSRYLGIGTPEWIESEIKKLRREAAKYRTRAGELEEAAKSAPVVPDGGRVISKEDAEAFDAFQSLKLRPDAIQAVVTERDQLKDSLARRDREAARDTAARALGIEGKDLASFAGADALTYEVREEEVERDGKREKAQVAYVKDSEGKESSLAEYGKEKWGRAFEAVLRAGKEKDATRDAGTRYTTQTGTGTAGAPADPITAALEQNKARASAPNVLRPAAS